MAYALVWTARWTNACTSEQCTDLMICIVSDHFNRHNCLLLIRRNAVGSGLHDNSECASAQLFAHYKFVPWKLEFLIVWQQITLIIQQYVWFNFIRIAFGETRL